MLVVILVYSTGLSLDHCAYQCTLLFDSCCLVCVLSCPTHVQLCVWLISHSRALSCLPDVLIFVLSCLGCLACACNINAVMPMP